jgi:dolichol-phosphate mannosyltransferase
MTVEYSIVVPVKDEEENLPSLIESIQKVLESLDKPWELILVNDGSTDKSLEVMKSHQASRPFIRILHFDKNHGESLATYTGLIHAKGPITISLDADLQNDPRDIPKLLEALPGHDLVCGWRVHRKDCWYKKWISRLANFIRSRICQDNVHDTGCTLRAYRTEKLRQIKMYNGMHRFLPALFSIEGFLVREIPVAHHPRTKGKSKYNFFNRGPSLLIDMLVVLWMRKKHLPVKDVKEL